MNVPEYRLTATQMRTVTALVHEKEKIVADAQVALAETEKAIDEHAVAWAKEAGVPLPTEGQKLMFAQDRANGPISLRIVEVRDESSPD